MICARKRSVRLVLLAGLEAEVELAEHPVEQVA